jgi:hypothetical protein
MPELAADSAVPGMGLPPPDAPLRAGVLAGPAEGRSARPGRAPSPASWVAAGTFVSPAVAGACPEVRSDPGAGALPAPATWDDGAPVPAVTGASAGTD